MKDNNELLYPAEQVAIIIQQCIALRELASSFWDRIESVEDALSIGTSDSWKKQDDEVQDLTRRALLNRRELLNNGIGTEADLKAVTLWICEIAETKLNDRRNLVADDTALQIQQCINQWRESCASCIAP